MEGRERADYFFDTSYRPALGCHQSLECSPAPARRPDRPEAQAHLSCTGATFDRASPASSDKAVDEAAARRLRHGPATNPVLDSRARTCRAEPRRQRHRVRERRQAAASGSPGVRRLTRSTKRRSASPAATSQRFTRPTSGSQIGRRGTPRSSCTRSTSIRSRPQTRTRAASTSRAAHHRFPARRDQPHDQRAGQAQRLIERGARNARRRGAGEQCFGDHAFCSDDPWIFGMDTGGRPAGDIPGDRLQDVGAVPPDDVVSRRSPIRSRGTSTRRCRCADGRHCRRREVRRRASLRARAAAGTTLVSRSPSQLPDQRPFLTPRLPDRHRRTTGTIGAAARQPGDKLWHYHDGAWEQVHATFDGTALQGDVTSLSPFAVGPRRAGQGHDHRRRRRRRARGRRLQRPSSRATSSQGDVGLRRRHQGDGRRRDACLRLQRHLRGRAHRPQRERRRRPRPQDGGVTNPGPDVVADVPATARPRRRRRARQPPSADPNGNIHDGWWEVDGKIIEPAGQLTEVAPTARGPTTRGRWCATTSSRRPARRSRSSSWPIRHPRSSACRPTGRWRPRVRRARPRPTRLPPRPTTSTDRWP